MCLLQTPKRLLIFRNSYKISIFTQTVKNNIFLVSRQRTGDKESTQIENPCEKNVRLDKNTSIIYQFKNSTAKIYLLKVNNRNTRKSYEISSKLTIKTPERRRSGVFIVNFEHISHLFLPSLLLTLSR